jgi:hypothetical protein
MSTNSANVVREIEEIHHLLEGWMTGRSEKATSLRRFESVLHEDFTFISSSGVEIDRAGFIEHLRQLQGQCADTRLWAENIRTICSSKLFVVACFEEYEHDKDIARARVSTVVFQCEDSHPNGLCWLRLHETRKQDRG